MTCNCDSVLRCPVGPLSIDLLSREAGVFVDPDAVPSVTNVLINGAVSTVLHAIVPMDNAGTPLPGRYRLVVDASGLNGGDTLEFIGTAIRDGAPADWRVEILMTASEQTAAPAPVDPLTACNDTFGDLTVDPQWTVDPRGAVIAEGASGLSFLPADNAGSAQAWFGPFVGPSLLKPVTGDFRATTQVRVTNDAGNGPPPLQAFVFLVGGLIAVDPTQPPSNTVHVAAAMFNSTYTAEVKTTDNDFSTIYADGALDTVEANGVVRSDFNLVSNGYIPATPTELVATLRLAREGQLFSLGLSFDGGATWPITQTVNRAQATPYDSGLGTPQPMPATVLVGPMAYNARGNPADLRVEFPTGIAFETIGPGFASGPGF